MTTEPTHPRGSANDPEADADRNPAGEPIDRRRALRLGLSSLVAAGLGLLSMPGCLIVDDDDDDRFRIESTEVVNDTATGRTVTLDSGGGEVPIGSIAPGETLVVRYGTNGIHEISCLSCNRFIRIFVNGGEPDIRRVFLSDLI